MPRARVADAATFSGSGSAATRTFGSVCAMKKGGESEGNLIN